MNFYDVIHSHRSIRKFTDQPIDEVVLKRILSAGARASSSGNMQAYSIIVTSGKELKGKLYRPHFEQSMVIDAPLLITFCADFHRMRQWLAINHAPMNFDNFMSFMIGTIDATLVAQNVALAAEAEGLGICFMGTTLASCLEIAEILECPEGVVPVVGFSLGHPAEDPATRDRLPTRALIHQEKYHRPTPEMVSDFYHEREVKGWERYMADDKLRKLVTESGVQNLAQVYTQLKYTKESHITYSQNVLRCLQQQNFMN
jgi:nitroreductase